MKSGLLVSTVCVIVFCSFCVYAVELTPDCEYVFNPADGTPPGFDASADVLWSALQMVDSDLPDTYQELDLDEDGIPDHYQMAMLGAVLCSDDADYLALFAANSILISTLSNNLYLACNRAGQLGDVLKNLSAVLLN